MKLISYIFPVYNNADSLEVLYSETIKITSKNSKYSYEFIFVNDGSKDNSLDVLHSLSQKDPRVLILNLSRNFGHQAAVSAGLDRCAGDAIIIMDADMQDPPAVCSELIVQWENGYDVVYAQRRTRQDTFLKKFTARIYYKLLTSMSSIDIPPNTGDFRLVDRKVVNAVLGMGEYHRFLRGMFSYVGFKHIAVSYDRHARYSGKSEYTFKKLMSLAGDGIFGFSELPLKLVTRLGFFVSIISVIGILYAITVKLFFTVVVPGWAMIIVTIFFMGGVQMITLGVIGEYIGRTFDEVRRRPVYIISEEITSAKAKSRK